MAEVIKCDLPVSEVKILVHGCVHVGSKAFHEKGFKAMLNRLRTEKNTYAVLNGDAVEGKKVDSPHFNPEGLHINQVRIEDQYRYFRDLIKPVASKYLFMGLGNHDRYLTRDLDPMRVMVCEPLGIPRGGYQTFASLGNGVNGFFWHGFPNMPNGAKDPIQRDANKRAWLKNKMEGLSSSHFAVMGHIHQLLVQPPLEKVVLGFNSKGDLVKEVLERGIPPQAVGRKGITWVPEESRWYGCNGTFRRTACLGYEDYGEIAGFAPVELGYLEVTLRDGVVRDMKAIHV